ncbi:MAG: AI-2E family transporter [Magnetococcales bacterium]|nr:AI-2E family transporter [Magnetococcales bacterium]
MKHTPLNRESDPPYQAGFLLTLILMAIGGLGWLFAPFLPGLFLAALLASSSYPLYQRIQTRLPNGSVKPALIMTVLMFFLVVSPILYLLVATAIKAGTLAHLIQTWFAGFAGGGALPREMHDILSTLPLPDDAREALFDWLNENRMKLGQTIGMVLLFVFKGITNNGLAFISSLVLVLFALFFFYRDGLILVQQLKLITPLKNCYDDLLLNRFSSLATVLTLSTLGVALLQGISFSLVTAFMGLPWFYLGVAIAASSFIPVVGGVVIWGPTAYILYWNGHHGQAIFLALWGAMVTGFVIDNLLRPLMMGWLSRLHTTEASGEFHVLNYTLLTVLSTFGGLIQFGILGLFFGPIIAAMAIAVFEVYQLIYADSLDAS